MLLMSDRERIKSDLLFILEKGEILLSSKRYDELLEKIIDILSILPEDLAIYRFLELFQKIVVILKDGHVEDYEILDLLITSIELLKGYENEIEEMEFENIDIDTFLLQSSRQILSLNKIIVENLSILNLLEKDKLRYFLQNNGELNVSIFTELKDINHIDIVLAPHNATIVQKIREITDKPIVVVSDKNNSDDLDKFENIFYVSDKLDEDEFNESLIQILNTYKCEYIKKQIESINNLKPLSKTITALQNLPESASLREISNIISEDIFLSTKLVSLVNKPIFGVSKEITSVNQAITFLGKEKTLAYAFSLEVSKNLEIKLDNYNMTEDQFNNINHLRLKLASLWYRKINFSDFIVISSAAMLGNFGKLFLNPIIDKIDKEKFRTLVKFDRLFAENEILQTSTEEITSHLLTTWNFSSILIDSIYYANNIEAAPNEIKHLAIVNYVIFNTFDTNDVIDDKVVSNMKDFLKEMNFDYNKYLEAIDKIREESDNISK